MKLKFNELNWSKVYLTSVLWDKIQYWLTSNMQCFVITSFLFILLGIHILLTTVTVVVFTLRASTTSLTPGLTGWSLLRSKTVHFKTDKIIESWVVVFVFHFQSSSIRVLTRVRFSSYHDRLPSRRHSQLFAGCLRDYILINFETFNSEEIVIGCFHQRRSSR